jgi:hypothetical protein
LFLARIIYNPQDGRDIFLRNVGPYTEYHTRHYFPGDGTYYGHFVLYSESRGLCRLSSNIKHLNWHNDTPCQSWGS